MIGFVLSSCPGDGNFSEMKLYAGIKTDNLEQINEALEDGANIDIISGICNPESNPVRIALDSNRHRIAEHLIRRGADPNHSDSNGISLLMSAAYDSNVHFCELLITHGAKVDKTDKEGNTALEYAVQSNRTEKEINCVIALLLDNGALIRPETFKAAIKVNTIGNGILRYGIIKKILEALIKEGYKSELDPLLEAAILGNSAIADLLSFTDEITGEYAQQVLFYTAVSGRVEIMKLLEEKGLVLDTCDIRNNTLLIKASEYGQLEMVKYLLSKGIGIESKNYDNDKALISAVRNNHYEVAEYLINKGADLSPYGFAGEKDLLYEAARNNNIKMMNLITSAGYPLNNDTTGKAMAAATDNDRLEALKYFLDSGAYPDIESSMAMIPLENSCLSGNLDAVKLLVETGAAINGKTGDGKPLNIASGYGNKDIVEYLINNGADVNATAISTAGEKAGLRGESSLMKAVARGNFDIVKLLVEHGADLEYQNQRLGMDTVIITTAGCGSSNILEYLLQKHVNIDYRNQNGQTALMRAVSNGRTENVKVLLNHGANTCIKDGSGYTALDIAKANKYNDIIDILEAALE
ncbi:MAG: ankyrin repeat domain-containing protein [Clostridia bacterium]|nr:ankyrin repeat domain-containing protein [Clostridia bacterium]